MAGEDWDVESYRNKFEPDEQWELRKKFMETHKDLFSEERVVCLAQVLVNVEFLGTKYPAETMRTVAELSLGFINEFRERGKTRLQRTFVGGSDAAQAKVKGRINFVKAMTNTLDGNDENEGKNPSVSIPSRKLMKETADALPAESSLEQSESTIKKKKKKNKEIETVDSAIVDDTNKVSIKEKKKRKKKEEVPDESSKDPSNKRRKKKLENKVEEGEGDPPSPEMVSKKKRKCQSADSTEPSDIKKVKVSAQTATCEIGEEAESQVCKTSKRKKAAIPESAPSSSTRYPDNVPPSKLPRFVLVLREGDDEKPGKLRPILNDSARLSRMSFDIKSQCVNEGEWESVVLFDGSLFSAAYSTTMKESQFEAMKKAFEELKRTNYQLIITEREVNSIQEFLINEDEQAIASNTNTKISTVSKDALTEAEAKPPAGDDGKVKSSFAMKMMKKMGWAGAGLGAQEQGITAPIEADVVVGRSGLGFDGSTDQNFEKSMNHYLRGYLASSATNKLIFSNQFSSQERAVIHGIARKIGLHSKSTGKDENRQLTVRRAPPQPRPLIEWVNQLKRSPHSKIELKHPSG